ncbi:hypothetical protein P170DRAFT_183469 [Aspergillus steynii IBT 23096]|uniref:Uncharacterized protein n=1 Tax=Aspergillus steynii IBT 23096 TaxID=1392250 RepID=A0A2I2G935_9EURO|nr:uncharacterized protein P170DRAFT_183469 [Aspergillus steynii IBT 23096]PLB49397.1 hypothetical protein P170DRAFT_183469 [Aspergillus steynii IBT 23096]
MRMCLYQINLSATIRNGWIGVFFSVAFFLFLCTFCSDIIMSFTFYEAALGIKELI